jgi:hypothetical protein
MGFASFHGKLCLENHQSQNPSHPPFAKGGIPLFEKEGLGEI